MNLAIKIIFKSILFCSIIIFFTQCSSSRPTVKMSTADVLFDYSLNKLDDLKGVLYLFRTANHGNPDSYAEIQNFIKGSKLNYNCPFDSLDYKPSYYNENESIIHFILKTNKENDKNLHDSVEINIESDAIIRFLSMESSMSMVYGLHMKGSLIKKGKEEKVTQDTTKYYMTIVSEKTLDKLGIKK
jgi:hypothetical protein